MPEEKIKDQKAKIKDTDLKLKNWVAVSLSTLFIFTLCSLIFNLKAEKALASEALYFISSDHLGSTTIITDQSGQVVSQQSYFPYGSTRAELTANGQKPTAHLYTSQVSDQAQTGLYYYNARYYNPIIAKFTQADVNQGPNRYLYVNNNPIKLIDPNGRSSRCTVGSSFAMHNCQDDTESQSSTGMSLSPSAVDNVVQISASETMLQTACAGGSGPGCGNTMPGNPQSDNGWLSYGISTEEQVGGAIVGGVATAVSGAAVGVAYAAPAIVAYAGTAATAAQQAIKMKIFERFGNTELAPAVRLYQQGKFSQGIQTARETAQKAYKFFSDFENGDWLPRKWDEAYATGSVYVRTGSEKFGALHGVSHLLDDAFGRAYSGAVTNVEGRIIAFQFATAREYVISNLAGEFKAYLTGWAAGQQSLAQASRSFWTISMAGKGAQDSWKVILIALGIIPK